MSKSQLTRVELENALQRLIAGKTERISPDRKISVKAVEEEAGLGDGSAYYYKDIVQKIKDTAAEYSQHKSARNEHEAKIASLRERLQNETRLKEKYRSEVNELKEKLSAMASQHNQLALIIQQYQYKLSELESCVELSPKRNT